MSVYTHSFIACRQTGQSTSDEIKSRDLRRELEDKEDISRHKRQREKPRSFTGNNYVTHLVDIYTIIYLYSVEERRGGGNIICFPGIYMAECLASFNKICS